MGGTTGGFLCDEQGLGKTLEVLMLALSNPPPQRWAAQTLEGAVLTEEAPAVPIKTTLVVVPANLLSQWAAEVATHLDPGALRWCGWGLRGTVEAWDSRCRGRPGS